jgi:hypothetical protein
MEEFEEIINVIFACLIGVALSACLFVWWST